MTMFSYPLDFDREVLLEELTYRADAWDDENDDLRAFVKSASDDVLRDAGQDAFDTLLDGLHQSWLTFVFEALELRVQP